MHDALINSTQKIPKFAVFVLLCHLLLGLDSGCSLAEKRHGHIVRPLQTHHWDVRSITIDQTSRPGHTDQLGCADITLELADQRQLRIHLDQRMSPPAVETIDAVSCHRQKRVYFGEDWVLMEKPQRGDNKPEYIIHGLRYETATE